MCAPPSGLSRRAFIVGVSAVVLASRTRSYAQEGSGVRPRDRWSEGLEPTGPLEAERPEDVRFLLVHHTATTNEYAPHHVPGQLRAIYRFHTGERGWPDVAYNFFVDRYGVVWEGRQGSLERPMKGDATGGSQGFAILCSFLGDHGSIPPTPAARDAMVGLLADLAARYSIDPRPGATTRFVSRGSSRWPAGHDVTAATIAGHRDMSVTACPGEAGYRLVRDELPRLVSERLGAAAPVATDAPRSPAPTAAPRTEEAAATPDPPVETAGPSPAPPAARPPSRPPDTARPVPAAAGAVGVAAAAAAAAALRRRQT
ncbi:MAG TPA: N-acetylmuramoyl-L-alanine amidase [Actinomycetota bacterium]|nr:N-acetylmuramoyl-L-alanine amidase [Actinomycetota bacterium]